MRIVGQILVVVLAWLFALTAAARDDEHLIPEDSVFSNHDYRRAPPLYADYYANVLSVLDDAFAPGIFARAIIFPSFQNEYAIAVAMDESSYRIIHLETDKKLWLFESLESLKAGEVRIYGDKTGSKLAAEIEELEDYLPDSPNDVSVDRCERPIPEVLGEKLYVLWGEMLFRTRYPDRRPVSPERDGIFNAGLDGTTYHFSFEYHYERLAGKVWSPDKDSITGQMVAITNLLRAACRAGKNEKILAETEQRIDELAELLSKTVY